MSNQDPAVRAWQDALDSQLSTSAAGRRLTGELDQLREQYNAVLLERDAPAAEVERLTARIARQPGAYHLTDKGLAATTPPSTKEN